MLHAKAIHVFTTIAAVAGLTASSALAADPAEAPDDSWISVDGTVESVSADAFVLDYGDGVMTVEMDDADRDADGYKLVEGDKVRVSGMIDDDLFEARTLEASSVYVENLDTYFFASAADEEDPLIATTMPVVISATVVDGIVTSVGDEEFTIYTAGETLRVEVEEMAYNPLDDTGYQQIEVGDRVRVTGDIDTDFFEGQTELVADTVVTLAD